jgi:bacillithiol biosynthesis cysteine-adding enzyme BshC
MAEEAIQFSETGLFSKLILDYLNGNPETKEFYSYRPQLDEIEKVIHDKIQLIEIDKDTGINREELVETITKQYSGLDITEKVSENIQSFSNSITFCLVTAHQLNIFTGPLYYIYKIAQTVTACRQLSEKYPNYNFVPVYWMGSEDHDFEEINHIHLFNKKIEWEDKQRGATGDYSTKSILPLIGRLKEILGEGPHAEELISLYQDAYSKPTLTEAARYLVNTLFGKYGLVVIDGNDKAFKKNFLPVMKDELVNRNSAKLVVGQLQKMDEKGYKAQAVPREINLFYLGKNSRERIEYHADSDSYTVLNTNLKFSREEITQELEAHPERFSPNVILRPLFQQAVLPSLAYIGGAGELSYWLQLKPVFEFYKINFPMLFLRNSALMLSEGITKKIEKLGFNTKDFFKDTDQLIKEFIARTSGDEIDVSECKVIIEREFTKLQEIAKNIDPTLVNAIGAEMQKSVQSLDNIHNKLVKSLKQKSENELNQIEKIKSQLFPENSLQERVENFSSYYSREGSAFIERLIDSFDLFDKQFIFL